MGVGFAEGTVCLGRGDVACGLGANCPVRSPFGICPSLNNDFWKYGVGKAAESLLFGSRSLQMGQCLK